MTVQSRALLFITVKFMLVVSLIWSTALQATPISQSRIAVNVDWCSAGISGTGAGSGTINLACVSGDIQSAFLYWHGVDTSGVGAIYDNSTVSLNGNPVTGTSLGDATTNCWGPGSSTAYEAEVTDLVLDNGPYLIEGLSTGAGHSSNGASLVVVLESS